MDSEKKEKKRGRGRYKYFADFEYKEYKTKSGKTRKKKVYTGDYFSFAVPKEYKKDERTFINRIKCFYALCAFGMLALWLIASFIGPEGLDAPYVLPSYVILAIPLVLTAFTIVEFLLTFNHRYDLSFSDALSKNLRVKTVISMIGGLMCAASQIVYLIINIGVKMNSAEYAYVILMGGVSALSWFFLKLQDSLPMQKL